MTKENLNDSLLWIQLLIGPKQSVLSQHPCLNGSLGAAVRHTAFALKILQAKVSDVAMALLSNTAEKLAILS